MSRILLITMELLVVSLISWYCVTREASDIEADLSMRTMAALNYIGLSSPQILMSGQTVTLRGAIASADDREQAENAAANVWGVSRVVNELQIPTATQQPPQPPVIRDTNEADLSRITASSPAQDHSNADISPGDPTDQCNRQLADIVNKRKVAFSLGSHELNDASLPLLDAVANLLSRCPNRTLRIEGHTDGEGDEADNLALSEARARSVANYLQSHGISSTRISIHGMGESRPIASNTTVAGREKNRRIEFILLPANPSTNNHIDRKP